MVFKKVSITVIIFLVLLCIPVVSKATDYVVALDAGHGGGAEDISWWEQLNGKSWDYGKWGTNADYDNTRSGIVNFSEAVWTKKTVMYMIEYLKQYDNIKVIVCPRTGKGHYSDRPFYARDNNANVHLSVHYNAGGGKGTITEHKKGDSKSANFATVILDAVTEATGLYKKGVFTDSAIGNVVSIMQNSSTMGGCPSVILECAFYDNDDDLLYISEEANVKKIAAGAVSGILSYLGVEDKGYPDIKDYSGYSGSSLSNLSGNSNMTITSNENKFLGLWKNATGVYESYYKEDGKTINDKSLYNKDGTEVIYSSYTASVADDIINASSWFFSMLEQSERTQNHLIIMKYLMNVYTDSKTYGDIDFDKDIASLFKSSSGFKRASSGCVSYESLNITDEDREILYKITYAERGDGTQQQQEYVVSVILNRVLSSKFPNTVREVVFAPNQFQPTRTGAYEAANPSQTTRDAVDNVLKTGDKSKMAVYFMTPKAAKGQSWLKNTIYLFNDVDESHKDDDNHGTHNFYTTDEIKNELKQYVKAGATKEGWSTMGVSCPRYYQGDDKWRSYPYYDAKSGTVGGGGCGACALAMATSGLLGEDITPIEIVELLNSNHIGTVNNCEGSSKLVAKQYGLTYEFIDRNNKSAIDAALDEGKCCIFSIDSNGIYTGGGHFIMCNGRDESGYYVLESGHFYETDTPYTYNQVFSPGVQGVFVLGK